TGRPGRRHPPPFLQVGAQSAAELPTCHLPSRLITRSYLWRGSARGRANLLVARGGWRNGRRARFRSVCPKGREGSNPSSPTYYYLLYLCLSGSLGCKDTVTGPR